MYYPFWEGANFQINYYIFLSFKKKYLKMAWQMNVSASSFQSCWRLAPWSPSLGFSLCRAEYNEKEWKRNRKKNTGIRSRRFEGLYWGAFLENDHYAQQMFDDLSWGFWGNFCSRTQIAHPSKKPCKMTSNPIRQGEKTTPSSTPKQKTYVH